ncbi:uncharacterized protein LOC100904419 [Galendromus occidentalis]|uniref:Uncharacterized protein LOC100904419 n=1 Tax=Galendromus occidentalis TaxID=34638 RepID=A0AAJ6VXF1_9ACAR|nr:uncharacterized protein LOC100904419 [Galendromus occidentalis]
MEQLNGFVENSDRDGITKLIETHIKEEHGGNLGGIYQAIRKATDAQGKQAFRLTIFRQILTSILKFWFLPGSEMSSESLNNLLVELLADVNLLSAADCSALCEVIIDNLGCPMTLELLSSLLLHASSTGANLPWRGSRVTDFKQALVSALVDKMPWRDDIVVHIAKFFREIELSNSLFGVVNPVLSPYINSLPSHLLLPFLSQILPIHPSVLQQVLQRLNPQNIDETTRAGVLAECVAATRQNPGIAKSVQALIKSNPVAILSDAFKFRLCLSVGSIHRNFQTPTQNALRAAVALHCDYELKRYEARWLSETLPVYAPLALVDACTLSTSDDKVFLTTNCLIDFGFLLLKTKTPPRVARQGALMLLTLCQTSSQAGTVQAVLDRLLRALFQNPSKECADLLAKLPCGQLPTSAGWDVISALPSVDPQVARTLVRVILESCPQIRNELVIALRKCLFLNDPASRLVAANGLLEIIAYFTVEDDDVSQNPNGRICLEALELIRRILVELSPSTVEIRHHILRGLSDLIKVNRMLKESIFELLQELMLQNPSDPHILMSVASCLCAYRKVHIKGTQKSQTLKWLFKRMVSMTTNVEETSQVDALILLSSEFGVDCSNVLEKLKEIRGAQDAASNADTTMASVASKAPRKKRAEKSAKHECLLSNEVLCNLLKSDSVHMEIRLYASDSLAPRKRIEPHERRQLLSALKDVLTKPYVDPETKACCVQMMSINFQSVVQDVFNSEDIPSAREELLKELGADSREALFKYFKEMIKQAKDSAERKDDVGALIACVQCMCLLFPDDVTLISDIYTWADDQSAENTIEYMPLLLDLASHMSGGVAVFKRLSQKLARLCGLLENSTAAQDGILQSLHTEDLPELFILFNAVVKSITGQLDWVFTKIELTEEMEPAFIKQLYYVVEALSTVAHSEVPLEYCDVLLNSTAKIYKVLTGLAKFYGSRNRAEVSTRYPKLVSFVQKVCTPRFEALVMRVEEEAARRNIGKKKQKSKEQQAAPAFVFALEQHHHELQKLSKKIELGDISTRAAARDFRIKVDEVKKHHDEWSDEEIPSSLRSPTGKESKSTVPKPQKDASAARKSVQKAKVSPGSKRKESVKVAWPPKKGKSADGADDGRKEIEDEPRSAFPESEDDVEPMTDCRSSSPAGAPGKNRPQDVLIRKFSSRQVPSGMCREVAAEETSANPGAPEMILLYVGAEPGLPIRFE